jgi:hypothetical protein
MYYRPQGPQNIAGHLYFLDGRLRVEALVQWGNDNLLVVGNVNTTLNVLGARGAAILDFGWIKFRYAHEYQQRTSPDPSPAARYEFQNRGGAGSIQLVFAPWIELGPNFGKAITDGFTPVTPAGESDPVLSGDILSYGGFLNLRPFNGLLIGTGANYASFTNLNRNMMTNELDKSSNTQFFVAVQYLVQRQLFVKLVGNYAETHFGSTVAGAFPYDDDMFSVRLRLMYLY